MPTELTPQSILYKTYWNRQLVSKSYILI